MRELTLPPAQIVRMLKVDGTANPADLLTKHLSKPVFKTYAYKLYNAHPDML